MNRDGRRLAIWASIGVSFFLFSPVRADETPMALKEVPSPIVAAAQKAAPGVQLSKALKTVEQGVTYYEIIGEDAEGREVDVELTARGEVVGIGTEIPIREVPKVVVAALKAKAPRGMKFTGAEVVTKANRLISYRFEGLTKDGDEVEATVSPDGKTVEIEVDDE